MKSSFIQPYFYKYRWGGGGGRPASPRVRLLGGLSPPAVLLGSYRISGLSIEKLLKQWLWPNVPIEDSSGAMFQT